MTKKETRRPQLLNKIPRWIWGSLVLLILIFIQHRFLLFSNLYQNIGENMAQRGDAYYTTSVYMQNLLNLLNGDWYSFNGDHYTWWNNIIGITGHAWAASIIFAPLYFIFDNPILAFNSMFFLNLIGIQLGIYLLLYRFTKGNNIVSILGSLMVPISGSFHTFYTGHIHAVYYWFLPYLLLSIDILFDPSQKKIAIWKQVLLYLGIAIGIYWLIFADWHVFVFGAIMVGFWGLYKLPTIITNIVDFKWRLIISSIIGSIIVISSIPFVLGVFNASNTFNSVRTVEDVNATVADTHRQYGISFIALPALKTAQSITTEGSSLHTKITNMIPVVSSSDSWYPDHFTTILTWIFVIAFIPWSLLLIWKRGKFYWREYTLTLTALTIAAIAIGPFFKAGGDTLLEVKLPHYYLREIAFPLQAIRAVWRASFIGYLATILVAGSFISVAWNSISKYKIPAPLKRLIAGYLAIMSIFVMVGINRGFQDQSYPGFKKDAEIFNVIDNNITEPSDVFVWHIPGPTNEAILEYYGYQFSWYNLEKRERIVNSVMGGIAGTIAQEFTFVDAAFHNNSNLDLVAEIIAAKNVEFVFQEKQRPFYPQAQTAEALNEHVEYASSLLDNYFNPIFEDDNRILWKIDNEAARPKTTQNIEHKLVASQKQSVSENISFGINIENNSDAMWVNPEVAAPVEYTVSTVQNGETKQTRTFAIGQPAFLPHHNGVTHFEEISPRGLKPGQAEIQLTQGDKKSTFNFEVYDRRNYNKLIEDLKNEPTTLSQENSPTLYHTGYSNHINLLTVPIAIDLESGVIDNLGKETFAGSGYRFYSEFITPEETTKGFPLYSNQPPCQINMNIFPGDSFNVWCRQLVPDSEFSEYRTRTVVIYK